MVAQRPTPLEDWATGSLSPPPTPPSLARVPLTPWRVARIVACPLPSCRAPVGSPCKRPSGHEVYGGGFHSQRVDVASQVVIDGLVCTRCGAPDALDNFVAPVTDSDDTRRLGLVGVDVCTRCAQTLANKPQNKSSSSLCAKSRDGAGISRRSRRAATK